MKICFISPKAYPLFNPKVKSVFGGAEVQIYLLSKEIAKNNNVIVKMMVGDYGQNTVENINNIRLYKGYGFKNKILCNIINFVKIFNEINADIYIQRTLNIFSPFIAILCKFKNKKFIYMVASDEEFFWKGRNISNAIKYFFSRLVFIFATDMVVQNDFQYKQIIKIFKKINVIKINSIIQDSYSDVVDINKKKYVLWVSRSDGIKQPEIFLDLARKNPELNFKMLCPQSSHDKELFATIKNEAKNISNLEFIEFVSYKNVIDLYKLARVFVNTSVLEGFPNTFLEAGINSVPVVSLNVDPNNFIVDMKCGFVCKGDFEKMNNSINELMNNDNLWEIFSNNIRSYVLASHSAKKESDKLIKLFYEDK